MTLQKKVRPDGTQEWRNRNGELHRDDGPAVIYPDGCEAWFQRGRVHRDDGPALVDPDGSTCWYQHGYLHREDGPGIIHHDGTHEWWLNGKQYDDEFVFRMELVLWQAGL
jgi:hypothetical protein